jgi:hypothetical protein
MGFGFYAYEFRYKSQTLRFRTDPFGNYIKSIVWNPTERQLNEKEIRLILTNYFYINNPNDTFTITDISIKNEYAIINYRSEMFVPYQNKTKVMNLHSGSVSDYIFADQCYNIGIMNVVYPSDSSKINMVRKAIPGKIVTNIGDIPEFNKRRLIYDDIINNIRPVQFKSANCIIAYGYYNNTLTCYEFDFNNDVLKNVFDLKIADKIGDYKYMR